jgi:hypothetical protein
VRTGAHNTPVSAECLLRAVPFRNDAGTAKAPVVEARRKASQPLAEQIRPRSLEEACRFALIGLRRGSHYWTALAKFTIVCRAMPCSL